MDLPGVRCHGEFCKVLAAFLSLSLFAVSYLQSYSNTGDRQPVVIPAPTVNVLAKLPTAAVRPHTLLMYGPGRGCYSGWYTNLPRTPALASACLGAQLKTQSLVGLQPTFRAAAFVAFSFCSSTKPFQPEHLSEFVTTSSGVLTPRLIYRIGKNTERVQDVVHSAVRAGFLGFDIPGQQERVNGTAVGAALASIFQSGIARNSMFIQTKVNLDDPTQVNARLTIAQHVKLSIADSLSHLGLEHVDSLLLQTPYAKHKKTMEAWRAMEDAVRTGLVRQLGISNVSSLEQLRSIHRDATLKPTVVQQRLSFETRYERDIRAWCDDAGVHFQSLGVLTATANSNFLGSLPMKLLVSKYRVTRELLLLRFVMGFGVGSLIGTTNEEHMKDAISAMHVPLSTEDAEVIDGLLKRAYMVWWKKDQKRLAVADGLFVQASAPQKRKKRRVWHFINLTNGLELLASLMRDCGVERSAVSFCRIQSSHCEHRNFVTVLREIDHNMLVRLAMGDVVLIHDCWSRDIYWPESTTSGENISEEGPGNDNMDSEAPLPGYPKAIWWGLEWVRYALHQIWNLGNPTAESNHAKWQLRGFDAERVYQQQVRELPDSLRNRLKYYRTLVAAANTREVLLYGASRWTYMDGERDWYAKQLLQSADEDVGDRTSGVAGRCSGSVVHEVDASYATYDSVLAQLRILDAARDSAGGSCRLIPPGSTIYYAKELIFDKRS